MTCNRFLQNGPKKRNSTQSDRPTFFFFFFFKEAPWLGLSSPGGRAPAAPGSPGVEGARGRSSGEMADGGWNHLRPALTNRAM
jgi:hypothetical protein